MAALEGLGSALRRLRMQRAITQTDLARQAGITKAMLSKYERGRQHPALGTLERILDALDASLGHLDLAMGEEREAQNPAAGPAARSSPPPWSARQVVFSPPPGLPAAAQAKLADVARSFGDFLYMLGERGGRQASPSPPTEED